MKLVITPSLFPLPLQDLWRRLVSNTVHNAEPKLWQSSDSSGKTCWHAYDPTTYKTTCLGSEMEARIWLEQRYYK